MNEKFLEFAFYKLLERSFPRESSTGFDCTDCYSAQAYSHIPFKYWTWDQKAVITAMLNRYKSKLFDLWEEFKSQEHIPEEIKAILEKLFPFQHDGVKALLPVDHGFIGDEQGLGKTVQGITYMAAKKAFPFIVACPASLIINWQREVGKWLPKKKIFMATGQTPYDDYPGDVVIVSYSVIKFHVAGLKMISPLGLLLDESQKIKNKKAGCTKAVFELAGYRTSKDGKLLPPKTHTFKNIVCLSGTPVLSRPREFLTQLKLLGLTRLFKSEWYYLNRYCGPKRNYFGMTFDGASNEMELNRILCGSGHYVRRRKREVLKDLPDKQYAVVSINLGSAGLREYRRAEKDIAARLKKEKNKVVQLAMIEELKQLSAKLKMPTVLSWLETFLESDEKILVFATHRLVVEEIAGKFKAPTLYGGMSAKKKQAAIDKFQTDYKTKIMVLNITAGGVGHTITAANNVAFVEFGWTPAEHKQAEDRAHRIGQTQTVTIWHLVAWETIEREILEKLQSKSKVVDAVTDGVIKKLRKLS